MSLNIQKIIRFSVSAAIVSALSFSACSPSASAASGNDVVKNFTTVSTQYKPFVRWWWNGDRVEAKELVRELHLLKDAGIGGVEINPIEFPYGGDPMDTKELVWLSDEWIDMLKVVFDEAEKIGMKCDLIVGSGWPFGAETLDYEDRASVMLTYAAPVKGGSRYETSEYTLFRLVDPGVTVENPGRRPHLEAFYLAPDPMSDLSDAIDLTDKFVDGKLVCEVPEGDWQVYALVRYESFASVINGAPGAAGSILNHMDAAAVRRYLDHMADTIESRIGPLSNHLRSFFVDSMELEGSNWTADFAQEFKARRGYDIKPWLPFIMFKVGRLGEVYGYDYGSRKTPEFNEQVCRVRFDFELTKAELLHERYTATFLQWCKDKGVKSRAQAYGRGFFPLESSMGYDIPEGESWTTNWLRHRVGEEMGDEDYRRGRAYTMINKYVSSTAHLTGKRIVSSEEMTNTYKVFTTSPEFLKVGSDMDVIAGVTHPVWSGFNYSPAEAPFPGWVQYGSFTNEHCPWWPYWHLLNEYRTRVSAVMQNADMVTDIAILPPNYDMWTEIGVQTDPFPWKLNVPYLSLLWEAIHKNGGGADYLSENIVKEMTVKGGKLCYGKKAYSVIFLPEVKSTTPETLAVLLEFIKQGGRMFCIGCKPSKSLGLKDSEARDKEIQFAVAELEKYPDNFIILDKPADGKYLEWYTSVMKEYGLPHAVTVRNPDRFLLLNHYLTDKGTDLFFVVNAHMSESRTADIMFPKKMIAGKKVLLLNPADGKVWSLPLRGNGISLELGPSESYILVLDGTGTKAPRWDAAPAEGNIVTKIDAWHLSMTHQQEGWTKEADMDSLFDFKNSADSSYLFFSGEATYTADVSLEEENLPHWINLGEVGIIASVKVNGHEAGTLWYGRRICDISQYVHAGHNIIEVKIVTLPGNYLQKLKDNLVAQRFIFKRNQPFVSTGLIGPVTLYN